MARLLILCLAFASFILNTPTQALAKEYNSVEEILADHKVAIPFPKQSLKIGTKTEVNAQVGLGYMAAKDPNYYWRSEKVELGQVTDLSKAITSRIGVHGEFYRPFLRNKLIRVKGKRNDSFYSITAPYKPKQAPHTWQKALALKQNEAYIFTGEIGLQMGRSTAIASGFINASIGVSYFISGDFQLKVIRGRRNRVIVRASTRNSRGGSIGSTPSFNLYEIGKVADAKKINLKPLSLELIGWSNGSQLSIEFVYDLSQPRAQQAYDQIMNIGQYKLKEFLTLLPGNRKSKKAILSGRINESVLGTLNPASGIEQKSISDAQFKKTSSGYSVRVAHAHKTIHKESAELNYSVSRGSNPKKHHYKVGTISLLNSFSNATRWNERRIEKDANAIFKTNAKYQIAAMKEINFSFQRSDVRFRQTNKYPEWNQVLGQMRKMIPPALFNENTYRSILNKRLGRRTYVQIKTVFGPQALKLLYDQLSDNEIKAIVNNYFSELAEVAISEEFGGFHFGETRLGKKFANSSKNEVNSLVDSVPENIQDTLLSILTRPQTSQQIANQWRNLKSVRRKKHLREHVSGLVARLLEEASVNINQLKSVMRIEIEVHAKDTKPYIQTLGSLPEDSEIELILSEKDQILNRTFDPTDLL